MNKMAETKPTKQYGLFVPKKKSVLQVRPSIFNDDENDEDEAKNVGVKLQKEGIKAATKKTTQLEMQKALAEDPTVYEYDKVYDAMELKKQQKQMLVSKEKKPKYIESLLKTAEMRKREYERRVERKVQKEREAEGEEFADKEAFVTSAYRKKMEEFQKIEEEERREEMLENLTDVTKQKDLSGFYRHLLRQKFDENKNEASLPAATSEDKASPKPEVTETKKETTNSEKSITGELPAEPPPITVKPKIKEEPGSSSENESAEFNKTNPKTKSQRNIRKRRSSSSSSDDSHQERRSKDRRKKSYSSDEDNHRKRSTDRRNRRESPLNNRSSHFRSSKPDYQRRRYFEKSPEKYRNYRNNRRSRESYSPRGVAPTHHKPRRYSRSSSRSSEDNRNARRDSRSRRWRNSSSDEKGKREARRSSSRSTKQSSKRHHSPELDRRPQPSNPVNVTQNYDKNSNDEESSDESRSKIQKTENSNGTVSKKAKEKPQESEKKTAEKVPEVANTHSDTEHENATADSKDGDAPSQPVNVKKLFAKRNVGDAITAARERYLVRQRARLLEETSSSSSIKET